MTLVEELLKADVKKVNELKTGSFPSKRLAYVLGKKDPVDIKIREIKSRRLNDIAATQYNNKGNFMMEKAYDAKLMTCVEGIVEPDLRDNNLKEHFGAKSAMELVEKIFSIEMVDIADAIEELSGAKKDEDKTEEEIKN